MKAIVLAGGVLALAVAHASASAYSDFNAGIVARVYNPDLAITDFTAALADPALLPSLRPVALIDRGDAYLQLKKYDQAIADFTASLALKPDFDALTHRGLTYYQMHRLDQTRADFNAAIAVQPGVPRGYFLRLNLNLEEQRFGDAVADGSTLIAMEPSASNYQLRSIAHRLNGDFAAASDDADKTIEMNPSSPVPHFNKAAILEAQGRLADSLTAVEDGLKLQPQGILGVMKKGILQWELQNFADAIQTFSQAAGIDPKNAYGFLWLTIARDAAHAPRDDDVSRVSALNLTVWPGSLVRLYQGSGTLDDVMTEARADAVYAKGRVCEADFYAAQWQLARGKPELARTLLTSAVRDCPYSFVELPAAVNQLKTLP